MTMTESSTRSVRLTRQQREIMEMALVRDVMVLQAADEFRRLEKRGLVRMELRNIGLRDPAWCIITTDAGNAALGRATMVSE